jgi:hypothetical protein
VQRARATLRTSPEPKIWSISGISAATSFGYRWVRQPVTMSFLQAPSAL